jgi:hypothetical protein
VPPVEPPVEVRVRLLPYVAVVGVMVMADWAIRETVIVTEFVEDVVK